MRQAFLRHCPVHVYDRYMKMMCESLALLDRKPFLCLGISKPSKTIAN